jgi:hypothetical protein
MCERHWLPLEIANASPSFLLQMLHVKNINWTLRFGAVASEPANLFSVALASDHKRKAAMDVKVFGLYLNPRFLSVCFNVGLESILCEVIFVRESEVAKHCIPGWSGEPQFCPLHKLDVVFKDNQLLNALFKLQSTAFSRAIFGVTSGNRCGLFWFPPDERQ